MTAPTFPPDFGPRLRAVMALHDIKHWQLAKRMDVSRGLVSQLCSGVKTPSGPVALAIRDALGQIPWEWLSGSTPSLYGCPPRCTVCARFK